MTEQDILNALKEPHNFKQFFKDIYALQYAVYTFPQHAKKLIMHVLQDDSEYKRYINSSFNLTVAAKLFPKYAKIFNQPSFEKSELLAREYRKAKSCHDDIGDSMRDNTLIKLPKDVRPQSCCSFM